MSLLGGRFKWITSIRNILGTIDETGTLNGKSFVIGGGDPSMGTGKAGAWSYSQIIGII